MKRVIFLIACIFTAGCISGSKTDPVKPYYDDSVITRIDADYFKEDSLMQEITADTEERQDGFTYFTVRINDEEVEFGIRTELPDLYPKISVGENQLLLRFLFRNDWVYAPIPAQRYCIRWMSRNYASYDGMEFVSYCIQKTGMDMPKGYIEYQNNGKWSLSGGTLLSGTPGFFGSDASETEKESTQYLLDLGQLVILSD